MNTHRINVFFFFFFLDICSLSAVKKPVFETHGARRFGLFPYNSSSRAQNVSFDNSARSIERDNSFHAFVRFCTIITSSTNTLIRAGRPRCIASYNLTSLISSAWRVSYNNFVINVPTRSTSQRGGRVGKQKGRCRRIKVRYDFRKRRWSIMHRASRFGTSRCKITTNKPGHPADGQKSRYLIIYRLPDFVSLTVTGWARTLNTRGRNSTNVRLSCEKFTHEKRYGSSARLPLMSNFC